VEQKLNPETKDTREDCVGLSLCFLYFANLIADKRNKCGRGVLARAIPFIARLVPRFWVSFDVSPFAEPHGSLCACFAALASATFTVTLPAYFPMGTGDCFLRVKKPEPPSGTREQFLFFSTDPGILSSDTVFFYGAPSLTRGRVCNLLLQVLLGLANVATLRYTFPRT
jgi:hypothetical protein